MFHINGVEVVDTFAEAFPISACALVVTAATKEWARVAGEMATGYGTSVIGCDCEAGIDTELTPEQTPDGRPGVRLLFFAFNRNALEKSVVNRVGQCVLTCPTTAVYEGIDRNWTPVSEPIRIGGSLRYFGDGWQVSKLLEQGMYGYLDRYWRIPTMDGEFLCQHEVLTTKGVAGGNLIVMGETQAAALDGASAAAEAARAIPLVILPFPGGVVRSGSKVGSKYKGLRASTNEAYCPTLRGVVPSDLPDGVNAAYELVIDGLSEYSVKDAMRDGLRAACQVSGVRRLSAGNYGGKLGKFHIQLKELISEARP